jgi:5-methylcytosine-specific restriction endonuclease McrA
VSWNRTRRAGLVRLVEVQDGLCAYCGKPFAPLKHSSLKWRAATLDHVRPRRMGHKGAGNLVAVHRVCNERKGDREPTACELLVLDAINAKRPIGCAGSVRRS